MKRFWMKWRKNMHKAWYFGTASDKTAIIDSKQKLIRGKEHKKKREKNQIGHHLGFEKSSIFFTIVDLMKQKRVSW